MEGRMQRALYLTGTSHSKILAKACKLQSLATYTCEAGRLDLKIASGVERYDGSFLWHDQCELLNDFMLEDWQGRY